VQNRPAFEIPYSEISNTNLAGKNEVAVEFALPLDKNDTGTNGALGGARGMGKKAGAGKDQLVEMRFYIPGVTTKKAALEGEDAGSEEEGEEEQNAATLFYDTLMEKAEIGEVAGDTFATFLDVLHLTPRYVSSKWAEFFTDCIQRTLRYRYVRKLLPVTWQDIRLQDPVRTYQEVHGSTKARRVTRYGLHWSRPSSSPRSNKIPLFGYAIQEG
jgi:structure-specific recognition protein 1